MADRTLVLNHTQISQKITRIAHQVLEKNTAVNELIIVGITPRGSELAKRIKAILDEIATGKVYYFDLTINKDEPLKHSIVCDLNPELASGKTVLLVDDVLNTGKALMYAAKYLLNFNLAGLQTATLIDRMHRNFPIRADYNGLSLATTIQEHIHVEFGEVDQAWLS